MLARPKLSALVSLLACGIALNAIGKVTSTVKIINDADADLTCVSVAYNNPTDGNKQLLNCTNMTKGSSTSGGSVTAHTMAPDYWWVQAKFPDGTVKSTSGSADNPNKQCNLESKDTSVEIRLYQGQVIIAPVKSSNCSASWYSPGAR